MRYDTPVYFQTVKTGEYDASTGNYAADSISEVLRYASVMDTGTDTMTKVYGKICQGSLTIHLQNHCTEPFDRIRVGEKLYRVDVARRLRTKQSFIVSEVQ